MKVKINKKLCNGTGLCENICPNVFRLEQGLSRVKIENVPADVQYQCKLAAQNCPNNAISIEFREIALYANK